MRGHNLIWHFWYPTWLPNDQAEITNDAARRFASIGERYGKTIGSWDVVNEPLERPDNVLLPKDYAYWAMTEAARDFPSTAKLDVNETGAVWMHFHEEDSPVYLLLENLRLRGARVDDIGFQFHLFNDQLYKNVLAGKAMKPLDMLRILDFYQKLQMPISISEITIPTLPCTVEGEATQAELVRDYYRLWFSHPAVKAITWWNLPDGTAAGTENRWCGGLLRKDLSPKASFTVLQNLIQKEWHTEGSRKSGTDSDLEFQGFYGEYELTATRAGQTVHQTIHLSKTGHNDFIVKLP
jgi:GH35 family endo-1,4-beta-xylanase